MEIELLCNMGDVFEYLKSEGVCLCESLKTHKNTSVKEAVNNLTKNYKVYLVNIKPSIEN